mgnify:CR=1 FL=1
MQTAAYGHLSAKPASSSSHSGAAEDGRSGKDGLNGRVGGIFGWERCLSRRIQGGGCGRKFDYSCSVVCLFCNSQQNSGRVLIGWGGWVCRDSKNGKGGLDGRVRAGGGGGYTCLCGCGCVWGRGRGWLHKQQQQYSAGHSWVTDRRMARQLPIPTHPVSLILSRYKAVAVQSEAAGCGSTP